MKRNPSDTRTNLQGDQSRQQNAYRHSGYEGSGYGSSSQEGIDWTFLVAGTLFAAAGGYLIYRGITAYGDTNDGFYDERTRFGGVQVRESVTVDKPASELYSYWRNLENLGSLMTHLESVRELGGERSRWVAKGPLGSSIEWDAVITDDRPDELVAWRSVENAQVPNEGAVRFSPTGRNGERTQVLVSLTYHPPGGQLGAAVAKLFGEEPAQQISDDLRRFKREMESGTLRGTPSGSRQSAILGHEEGTPSLGVPGSSSGLRSDNLEKDPIHTEGNAIPSPDGGDLKTTGQPRSEATGYADANDLTRKSGQALPKTGDAREKN